MSVIDSDELPGPLDPDGLTGDELVGDEFDSDAWLDELDDLVADYIEDVVGGDYE